MSLTLLPFAVADVLLRSESAEEHLEAHHSASRHRQSAVILASGAAEESEMLPVAAMDDMGVNPWPQTCNVSSTWYYVSIYASVGYVVQCSNVPGKIVCLSQDQNGACQATTPSPLPQNLAAVCPPITNVTTTAEYTCPGPQLTGSNPDGSNKYQFMPNASYVDPCNATAGLGCYDTTTPAPGVAAQIVPEIDQGILGATGVQGVVGDQGYSPPLGNTGTPGVNGAQGSQGPVGDPGPTGPQGKRGSATLPDAIPNDLAPNWWGFVIPFAQVVLLGCGYSFIKNFIETRKKEIEFAKSQDWDDAGAVGQQW